MTPEQLAAELEEHTRPPTECDWITSELVLEAAKMLREKAAEIERLMGDAENLLWNLGGCSTIACAGKPMEFNRDLARPALIEVNELAEKLQSAKTKITDLQNQLAAVVTERDGLMAEIERLNASLDNMAGISGE